MRALGSDLARRPHIGVFAVDDRSVQLTWRHLQPGPLVVQVRSASSVAPNGRFLPADRRGGRGEPHKVGGPPPWRRDGDGRLVLDEGAGDGPGAMVVDGLPPGRLFAVTVSGPAVGDERVLAVRTLAPLAGQEQCRIATLSDLHLGTHVFGHRGTIREHPRPDVPHPERCTEAAIDEATAWGAERIVVKGDLTNHGTTAQWRTYARLVGASPVPVDAMAGNHDHAHPVGQAALAPAAAAAAFRLSIAQPVLVRDLPGLRLVLVDSTRPGRHGGSLAAVADDVVEVAADADRAGGVLVALHHQLQPHRLAEGWPTGIGRDESRRFLERLGAVHPHVLVTSGHTHRHRRWGHAGVTATQVGSAKDYPGVWAGYVVAEGGMRQIVRRVARPDVMTWTDHSRRAALGAWRHVSPGRLDARCFDLPWTVPG